MVRRDRGRPGEPELRELVQHLALRRDGADDSVERGQSIGDDDDALAAIAIDVAIANLAVVALELATTDGLPRRGVERGAELSAK